MAFCTNCGKEVPEGTKFCPNCGTAIQTRDRGVEVQKSVGDSGTETQNDVENRGSHGKLGSISKTAKLDKYGKFYGVILFVLALFIGNMEPPIVMILLSLPILAACIFCLIKKYKWKGFTIVALIYALASLIGGTNQAKEYGAFSTQRSIQQEKEADRNAAKEESAATGSVTMDRNTDQVAESDPETESTKNMAEEEIVAENSEVAAAVEESAAGSEGNQSGGDAGNAVGSSSEVEVKEGEKANAGGVNPEMKAFLDEYESFMDEYVDFMKKYSSDSANSLTMLTDYMAMLQKLEDFGEKADAWDSTEMSDADYAYYIETMNRINTKLLTAY